MSDEMEFNPFAEWNTGNIRTHLVGHFDGMPYVLVHKRHPTAAILRLNADIIGANIDDQPLIDGEWHRVTCQVHEMICITLIRQMLKSQTQQ